jgi:hypothetical protein
VIAQLIRIVPRAVAAHHQVFCHRYPPRQAVWTTRVYARPTRAVEGSGVVRSEGLRTLSSLALRRA